MLLKRLGLFQQSTERTLPTAAPNQEQLAESNIRDVAKLMHASERIAFLAEAGMIGTHSVEPVNLAKMEIEQAQKAKLNPPTASQPAESATLTFKK